MIHGHVLDGRYRLADRLGQGGMSVVWQAHDDVLERDVAVKVLSPRLAVDSQVVQRVHREARAAASLRHPNIVEVYDYGQQDDGVGHLMPYVVMELVEGRSLEQMLTAGALPWRLAVLVGAQVAAALAAAHERGIVHRDVKPGNVMISGHGVKLVDFGISASMGCTDREDGELLGTPAYLAPERLEDGTVRGATDVYALGLLLYRMLTDRLPWQASTTTEMLKAHLYYEPAALPHIDGLPPEVVELCRQCLAKQPDDRPAASDVATVLGRTAGVSPPLLTPDTAPWTETPSVDTVPHRPSPDPVTPRAAWPRWWSSRPARRRIVVPLTAAAVLLTAAALGLARFGEDPASTSTAALAVPAATVPASPSQAQCSVRYAMRHTGNGQFSTAVTLANTGKTPVKNWRLTFAFTA